MTIYEKVEKIINSLRPFIQQDGGDMEFVDYKNHTVYLRVLKACIGCPLIDNTIENGILRILQEELEDEVKMVELIL